MKRLMGGIAQRLHDAVVDSEKRTRLSFITLFVLLGTIAAGMTVLNIFTNKGLLTLATAAFAAAEFALALAFYKRFIGEKTSIVLFGATVCVLFSYFIVSGNPDGFSVLWICLLPVLSPLIFGWRRGSLICAIMLLVVGFFFYTPLGFSLLQFDYGETFRMRFPLLYTAFYLVGTVVEIIRHRTQIELESTRARFEYQSVHDALTGTYNRLGFDRHFKAMIQDSADDVLLVILDLDHFKAINDTYGHTTGDLVLKEAAARFAKAAPEGGVLCRWGGEEFALIVPLSPSGTDARTITESVRAALGATPVNTPAGAIPVTASAGGVMACRDEHPDAASVVRAADALLYQAKEGGRNRSCFKMGL